MIKYEKLREYLLSDGRQAFRLNFDAFTAERLKSLAFLSIESKYKHPSGCFSV